MSEAMMGVLQRQVESLTRQVEILGPENERVRKLLTEFDLRHDADQAEIKRLRALCDLWVPSTECQTGKTVDYSKEASDG